MNLFIDTNVLLNFYHFSKDSLDELEKVFVLQNFGKVNIWLTDQVEIEFRRNRETKIADALKTFLDEKPNSGIPHVARGFEECDQLVEALKQVNLLREELIKKVRNEITTKTLYADILIDEIFAKSNRIIFKENQFNAAKRRSDLRNPPGKNNSLGDAINWEALLEKIPESQDIFIVSNDGDFYRPLDIERISDFLSEEWSAKKKSKAILYRRLSQFITQKFPGAKIAEELEKDIVISELINSGSFAKTHRTIEILSTYSKFSPKQANEIVDAYIVNGQIFSIALDADINKFGKRILEEHSATLDPAQLKAFLCVLS